MRIGIEMRLVTLRDAGGIALLLRGVLRSLFERNPQHQFLCFHTVFNRGLLGEVPSNVQLHTFTLGSYFQDIGRLCAEQQVDVLIRGYPLEQQIDFPACRQIVQIPDLQHEQFPEFFDAEALRSRRAAFGQALGSAGAIATISEFARKTLLEQRGARCRDIFLTCPALQVEHRGFEPLTDDESALIPKNDYFLFPANLWKHKNHDRVLRAFERCVQSTPHPIEFLFTGHREGWEKLHRRFKHLPICHLGFVRSALMRRLLEGARALVFFSLYEGFGMPLLEAFDAGTPVLCSNTTSLPEVGGDAVLSCDPTDSDAMSHLMGRILREPERRPICAQRGKERLKAYTWEQSADNLMAACQRVVQRAEEAKRPALTRISVSDWPRVAIVTPSFNQGRFLGRTIDSVLSQSYPHIDYLVADGGSTDETLEVLRSHGNRVKWFSEPDHGQSHAINKGLALVKGDIQAYLNSDDILLPGAVERAVNYLLGHPDADMVYGKAHFIDEDDRTIGDYNTAPYSFDRLMADCCISQPAAFWRTCIAEKVGPFDESLHFALDYDYWQRIDRAGGHIDYLEDFLACTRLHAAAKTVARHTEMMREVIQVCMKNAGFASLAYYQGLWHSMCQDRSGPTRLMRRVPGFPSVISRLHHRWANRTTYGNRELLRESIQAFRKQYRKPLRPLWLCVKPLLKMASPTTAKQLMRWARPRIVKGFWGDNWLEETCRVRLPDGLTSEEIKLIGTAPEPMEVTVIVKNQPKLVVSLEGAKVEQLSFHVPPGKGRKVSLRFSKHIIDAAERRLSFRLEETNLFSEHDFAA